MSIYDILCIDKVISIHGYLLLNMSFLLIVKSFIIQTKKRFLNNCESIVIRIFMQIIDERLQKLHVSK